MIYAQLLSLHPLGASLSHWEEDCSSSVVGIHVTRFAQSAAPRWFLHSSPGNVLSACQALCALLILTHLFPTLSIPTIVPGTGKNRPFFLLLNADQALPYAKLFSQVCKGDT